MAKSGGQKSRGLVSRKVIHAELCIRSPWQQCLKGGGDGRQREGQGGRKHYPPGRDYAPVQVRGWGNPKESTRNENEGRDEARQTLAVGSGDRLDVGKEVQDNSEIEHERLGESRCHEPR